MALVSFALVEVTRTLTLHSGHDSTQLTLEYDINDDQKIGTDEMMYYFTKIQQ